MLDRDNLIRSQCYSRILRPLPIQVQPVDRATLAFKHYQDYCIFFSIGHAASSITWPKWREMEESGWRTQVLSPPTARSPRSRSPPNPSQLRRCGGGLLPEEHSLSASSSERAVCTNDCRFTLPCMHKCQMSTMFSNFEYSKSCKQCINLFL